ncbi:MAG: hypothetical protein IPJ52_09440 [Rhodocyclaceae bacterium]|nr:hypothetical protein [Rhodocyclaceae bacterium]
MKRWAILARAFFRQGFRPDPKRFPLRMGGTRGVLKVAREYGIEKEVASYVDDLAGVDSLTRIQKRVKVVDELVAHAATTGEISKAVKVYLGKLKEALHRFAVKHNWSWMARRLEGFSDWDMAIFLQRAKNAIVTGKTPEGDDIAFRRLTNTGPR